METESSDEIDLLKITDEVLSSHCTRKIFFNSIHALLGQFEAHLDSIIKRYKIMTITLLIATAAAIGFSFSGELRDFQVNKLIMAGIACILGMIGITSIWYLDLQVFHKFWASFFLEEVFMEEKYSFLVDIGDIAISLDNFKSRVMGEGNFYIFLNIILIVTSTTVFTYISNSIEYKTIVCVSAAVVAVLIILVMKRESKKLLHVVEQLLNYKLSC